MVELVECITRDRVLVISMQREAKRNAVNRELADALELALNRLDDDDDLWVGVLTGTSSVFSAGSDLMCNGDYVTERGGEYGVIRRNRRKPLIAAVEGLALGGGLEIVLACDMVVAARDATFGLPEVSRGLVPSCGALFRGPRVLPLNLARELIMTGERMDAARLYAAGVVNALTEPGGAVEAAVAMATRITANAPLSVQACLQAVNAVAGSGDDDGWSATSAAVAQTVATDDMREGLRAFAEKRSPVWLGR